MRKNTYYLNEAVLCLMDLFSFKIRIMWTTVYRLFPNSFKIVFIMDTFNCCICKKKKMYFLLAGHSATCSTLLSLAAFVPYFIVFKARY